MVGSHIPSKLSIALSFYLHTLSSVWLPTVEISSPPSQLPPLDLRGVLMPIPVALLSLSNSSPPQRPSLAFHPLLLSHCINLLSSQSPSLTFPLPFLQETQLYDGPLLPEAAAHMKTPGPSQCGPGFVGSAVTHIPSLPPLQSHQTSCCSQHTTSQITTPKQIESILYGHLFPVLCPVSPISLHYELA